MSDFMAKMHQIRFRLGLRPRPRWGSSQRSPDRLAGFKGATSKGREERGRGGERRGGKEREGRRGGGDGMLDLSASSF